MVENSNNEQLNRLLINISRSLLQYIGECWPWTEVDADNERLVITKAVDRQRGSVRRLAGLLEDRHWPIDVGSYPTDFTDLHYVALDFLLSQLKSDEESLIGDLKLTAERLAKNGDGEGQAVISEVLAIEQQNLTDMQELIKLHAAGNAV